MVEETSFPISSPQLTGADEPALQIDPAGYELNSFQRIALLDRLSLIRYEFIHIVSVDREGRRSCLPPSLPVHNSLRQVTQYLVPAENPFPEFH